MIKMMERHALKEWERELGKREWKEQNKSKQRSRTKIENEKLLKKLWVLFSLLYGITV